MENFPHPPTMILVAAAVVALVFVLNRWLFGPLNEILRRRQGEVDDAQARFEQAQKLQAERLEAIESALTQARQEAFRIREQAQNAARDKRDRVLADARAEATEQVERAKAELQAAVAAAERRLEQQAEQIARAVAAKLLGRPVTRESDR